MLQISSESLKKLTKIQNLLFLSTLLFVSLRVAQAIPQSLWFPQIAAVGILISIALDYCFSKIPFSKIYLKNYRVPFLIFICMSLFIEKMHRDGNSKIGWYFSWFWITLLGSFCVVVWSSQNKNGVQAVQKNKKLLWNEFIYKFGLGLLWIHILLRLKFSINEPVALWMYFLGGVICSFWFVKWLKEKDLRQNSLWIYALLGIAFILPRFLIGQSGYLLGSATFVQDLVAVLIFALIGVPFLLLFLSESDGSSGSGNAYLSTQNFGVLGITALAFAVLTTNAVVSNPVLFYFIGFVGWLIVGFHYLSHFGWQSSETKGKKIFDFVFWKQNPIVIFFFGMVSLFHFLSFVSALSSLELTSAENASPKGGQSAVFRGGHLFEVVKNRMTRDLQLRRDKLTVLESSSSYAERQRIASLGMFVHPSAKKVLWIGGSHPIAIRYLLDLPQLEVTLLDYEGIYSTVVKYFPPLKENSKLVVTDGNPFLFLKSQKVNGEKFDLILVGEVSPSDSVAQILYSKQWLKLAVECLSENGRVIQAIRPVHFSEEMMKRWVDAWVFASAFLNEASSSEKVANGSGFDFWRTDLLPEALRYVLVSKPKGSSDATPWDTSENLKSQRLDVGKRDFFFSNPTLGPVLWVASGDKVVRWFTRQISPHFQPWESSGFNLWISSGSWRRQKDKMLPLHSGVDLLSDLVESEVPLSVGSLKWTQALELFRQGDPQWRISYSQANVLLGRAFDSTSYADLFAE